MRFPVQLNPPRSARPATRLTAMAAGAIATKSTVGPMASAAKVERAGSASAPPISQVSATATAGVPSPSSLPPMSASAWPR